jgi:ribonuclease P protein component
MNWSSSCSERISRPADGVKRPMVSAPKWRLKQVAKSFLSAVQKAENALRSAQVANKSRLISLRRKRDFDQLRQRGQTVHPCAWLVVNYQPNELSQVRCGWTVPRYVGNATVRNKLKRWGREFLRKWTKQNELSIDINFIFKRKADGFYKDLSHVEFDSAFDRCIRKVARSAFA